MQHATAMDRRRFVKVAGGLAVAAMGCKGIGEAGSGTVRVVIRGLAADATEFGSAIITGDSLPDPIELDLIAASGQQTVMVGTYHVVYSAPGGYGFSPGTSNEADVTVNDGQITDVEFFLEQVVGGGSVRVTAIGLTPTVTSGGYSTILRTDLPGQTPIALPIPSGGQAEVALLAGTYAVSYTAPSGFRLASGQTNPQTITVVDAQVAVTFNVEEAPPATGIVFRSDWGTELGKGDAALRDTAKAVPWGVVIGGNTALTVIPTGALGFPTSNCLQVDCVVRVPPDPVQEFATGAVSLLPGGGAWPIPEVGRSLYFRMYKRMVYPHSSNEPPPAGNNNHCVEERSGGSTNWQWTFNTGPNGWNPSFNIWVSGTPHRFALRDGSGNRLYLARNQVYRLEWAIHRTGSTTRTHEVRVYDAADAQIHDTGDFRKDSFEGGTVLTGFSESMNPAQLDGFQMGTNGMGFNDPGPALSVIPAWYFAAVAVSDSTWVGPFSGV